jgi:hypothetical protein
MMQREFMVGGKILKYRCSGRIAEEKSLQVGEETIGKEKYECLQYFRVNQFFAIV